MFINRYLIKFAASSKKLILSSCGLELLITLLDTCVSICSAMAINMIISDTEIFVFSNVFQPFVCVFVFLLVRFVLYRLKVLSTNQCSNQIKTNLRQQLLKKLFLLGPSYSSQKRTGDLANTVSNKVEWLSNYYTMYLPASVASIVNAVLILSILFCLDWMLSVVCIVACIGILGSPLIFYSLTRDRGEQEWIAHTSYYSDYLDSIQGITTLKSFNANRQRRAYIHRKGEELRQKVMSQLRITMLETGLLEFFVRLGSAFSVAIAVLRAIDGAFPIEQLIYALFLTGACFTPMMNLSNAWHMGYRGITASGSIAELLNEPTPFLVPEKKTSSNLTVEENDYDFKGDICFRDVSFRYNEKEGDVLHDISFTIPNQTMMAIVGPSGSGKSTIAHLLSGFYLVDRGEIQVGNKILNEQNVGDIQKLISAVWQDSHIFYGTVYENIMIGRPNAAYEDVIEAAKKANLHEFVTSLPDGYNTILGENGMRFSGGERQRIALARAFLKDSPIIIFDEATSSLDRKNEIEIQESFSHLRKEKTALVIAHRLTTIQQAEQICIVEKGKIVAYGTHEQLAQTSELYQKLMGDQFQVGKGVAYA